MRHVIAAFVIHKFRLVKFFVFLITLNHTLLFLQDLNLDHLNPLLKDHPEEKVARKAARTVDLREVGRNQVKNLLEDPVLNRLNLLVANKAEEEVEVQTSFWRKLSKNKSRAIVVLSV